MRNLITIVLMFLTCTLLAQTRVGVAGGLYEDSMKRGVGYAVEISASQEVINKFGIVATYSYLAHPLGDLTQLKAEGYYEETFDLLSLRGRAGVALQSDQDKYFSFGVDTLVKAVDNIQVMWSWSPVIKGHFRDEGWTHTVTMGVLIKL